MGYACDGTSATLEPPLTHAEAQAHGRKLARTCLCFALYRSPID